MDRGRRLFEYLTEATVAAAHQCGIDESGYIKEKELDDIVKETRKYAELALSSDNKNYYTLVADTIDRLRAEVARLQGQLDARIEQLHESESYGFRLTQQLAAANGRVEMIKAALTEYSSQTNPSGVCTVTTKYADAALSNLNEENRG